MSAAPARLLGIATALPPHRFSQAEARAAAAAVFADAFPDIDRLLPLYENSGIGFRSSARPLAWHASGHGFAERNRVFLETAETLLADCALQAIAQAGLTVADIDAVVAVCSTGIATPGLDAMVAERIGLRPDVVRTPIFGLGCGGGVMGVARAATLARAEPGSRVLLLVVELCTLALRLTDRSKANLVACALFGDGAGAVVLSTEGDGPAVVASGEHRWPNSLDVMGWTIQDDGLGVLFSVRVPEVVRRHMRGATDAFLERAGRRRAAIDGWICHPGGAKVVSGLEEALEVGPEAMAIPRQVLHDCGNMSAASILFVLERALARPDWALGLMLAMGPGFSAGFTLLER